MKKFSLITLRYLCGIILLTSSCGLSANETTRTEELRQLPAGSRPLLHSEYVAIKERLAQEEQQGEDTQKEGEEESSSSQESEETTPAVPEENKENPPSASILKTPAFSTILPGSTNASVIYYTSHNGVFHQPLAVGAYGSTVELEDNSVWSISPDDSYKTLNWLTLKMTDPSKSKPDTILILPNREWFSVYNYLLVNQDTGTTVRANLTLYLNPVYHTIYNHRVVAIDDVLQMIWLEDGSVWSIASCDYSTKWQLNDTIIIGINDGFLSYSRPNILINANILHHVRANCIK